MRRYANRRAFGFTLTEMAIVLGVVGVLAAGLWNLMSGANEQVRDSAAANQHSQLITSVRSYLSSSAGQLYMTNNSIPAASGGCGGANCAVNANFSLPLPSTAACTDFGDLNWQAFCTYLPAGFLSSTVNAYGQTFVIRAMRDNSTGTPPATYSFVIMTTGGNNIPDTSGARISALIGGDGGFIYNNAVCTAAVSSTVACGSFGGWTATLPGVGPGGYGFGAPVTPAPASGTIASRTYVSPQQNSFYSWLARIPMPGDTSFTLNTMITPEYLGDQALVMGKYLGIYPATDATNTIYMGDYAAPVPNNGGTFNLQGGVINFLSAAPVVSGTGTINMQGGTINTGGGQITGTAVFGNLVPISLTASGASSPNLINLTINGAAGGPPPNAGPALNISTGCTQDAAAAFAGFPNIAGCIAGIQVTGDGSFAGQLTANSLFAQTFIYQSSDVRLKTDIHPLLDSLSNVMLLKPVSFTFKANGYKGLGVLAQDVEKIYPQLVTQNDKGIKSVNYDGLIAPLIAAVQELKEENDDLRRQLQQQKVRQDELEKKLGDRVKQE